MKFKKLVIVLIFLIAVPVVNSSFTFQCKNGTLFGSCSDNWQLCVGSENLLDTEVLSLDSNEKYLFSGRTIVIPFWKSEVKALN